MTEIRYPLMPVSEQDFASCIEQGKTNGDIAGLPIIWSPERWDKQEYPWYWPEVLPEQRITIHRLDDVAFLYDGSGLSGKAPASSPMILILVRRLRCFRDGVSGHRDRRSSRNDLAFLRMAHHGAAPTDPRTAFRAAAGTRSEARPGDWLGHYG